MKKKIRIEPETGIQKLIRLNKMKEKAEEMDEAMMEARMFAMASKLDFGRKKK
jgi:hypothetical protein